MQNMQSVLTVCSDTLEELRQYFSQAKENREERLYAGLLTINQTENRREFFLRKPIFPKEEDYLIRSCVRVSVKPDFLAELLCDSKSYRGILLWHNHLGAAIPSYTDDIEIPKVIQNAHDFRHGNFVLRGIWGSNGLFVQVTNKDMDGKWEVIDIIKVIGDNGVQLICPENLPDLSNLPTNGKGIPIDLERHNRTLNFLGEKGEKTLQLIQSLRWGLIGAGGIMSAFADVFKFFGVKHLTIVDADKVERSNANRLFGYKYGDEGQFKANVIKRELLAFDPQMEVKVVRAMFPEEETLLALKDCDFIICGPDNDFCRYHASEYASRYWKPLLELGSGIHIDKNTKEPIVVGSQVRFQLPTNDGKCLACNGLETENLINPNYKAMIRESSLKVGYIQDSDLPTPASVVTINSLIATIGVRLILSHLSRIGKTPNYLIYDELKLEFKDVSSIFKKRPDCPLCGHIESSLFGWGDELPEHLSIVKPPET